MCDYAFCILAYQSAYVWYVLRILSHKAGYVWHGLDYLLPEGCLCVLAFVLFTLSYSKSSDSLHHSANKLLHVGKCL